MTSAEKQTIIRTISVELNKKERMDRFLAYHMRYAIQGRTISIISCIVCAILGSLILSVTLFFAVMFYIFSLLLAFWTYFEVEGARSKIQKLEKVCPIQYSVKQSVTLSDEGITVESHDGYRQFVPWIRVTYIQEYKSILILSCGLFDDITIPLRAFPDDESCQMFQKFSEDKLFSCRADSTLIG